MYVINHVNAEALTTGVIRNRLSQKDRQYRGQNKNDKWTNDHPQNAT